MGTHAERDYFLRAGKRNLFDSVIVNANLVEATRDATGVLLIRLNKPYLIDPITYAFALDPALLRSTTQPKDPKSPPRARSTFQSLAQIFSLPNAEAIGKNRLKPGDFSAKTFSTMVDQVLHYQNDAVAESLSNNAEFIGAELEGIAARPEGLIAPYFIDDFGGGWREWNVAAMAQAAQTHKGAAIGMIAYDSTSSSINQTIPLGLKMLETPIERFIVWPADLDEHQAVKSSLEAYVTLVQQLAKAGRTVWAAYGGFFAILLRYKGLEGISHGFGYGDKRQTEPVTGGGLPPVTYYARPVRDTVALGTLSLLADDLTTDQYKERICDCTICVGLLERGGVEALLAALSETELKASPNRGLVEVSTPYAYRLTRFHYLLNRVSEIQWVQSGLAQDQITERLRSDAEWAAERIGDRYVRHIPRWIEVAEA